MKNPVIVFMTFFLTTIAEAQQSNQPYIDSLKQQLTIAKEDTIKVQILAELIELYSVYHPDTAITYGQQALQLSEKLNFEEGILFSTGTLSISLQYAGNYPLALDYAFKTLSLAKKTSPSAIPWATSLVAYSYYYLGEYNTFLKYTLDAMKLATPREMPYGWRDLSMGHHKLNEPDSALLYAKRAYEQFKSSEEGSILSILGDAYMGKAYYDSALVLYRNGISVSLKNHVEAELIDNYNGIADVYKATNNFDSAIWYSKKALSEKIERRYPLGLLRASNMLANIYGSQNNADSALKYLRTAVAVKDSLFSLEKTVAIQNLAFKEQEKQKEIEASELKFQNRLRIYSLSGGIFILLVIAGILIRNNRNKQRTNALLQQQKEKVESTLIELKSTQSQLIQSEKMASLGELTAGIAHEIQNPLNFVNNFSEVNNELIEELKSENTIPIAIGMKSEERAVILDNIYQNNEKIKFHGKRAEAIVKNMMQHAGSRSAVKEATDINSLVEEYLRLAYHGTRAKDKSFNAKVETHFDERIGKINIVPQEIGRVILNLINNAFYAVNEKQNFRSNLPGETSYEPVVSISTSREDARPDDPVGRGNVKITVKDNGNGIPGKIRDKVFQPFFTTKPAGLGTGLGLSLAYDIVKAHGGELKVETKENEGAEFMIYLPESKISLA